MTGRDTAGALHRTAVLPVGGAGQEVGQEDGQKGTKQAQGEFAGHTPADRNHYPPAWGQEQAYRGPLPGIPDLLRPDPRGLAKLQRAMEESFPPRSGISEGMKFRILQEHLKFEEATLVAEAHADSTRPYSKTMKALNEQFGRFQEVVKQSMTEIVRGPNISGEDTTELRKFALRVQTLVALLVRSGEAGRAELKGVSQVSRLLDKLSPDLETAFRRDLAGKHIRDPTLPDLSRWLQEEMKVRPIRSMTEKYGAIPPMTQQKPYRVPSPRRVTQPYKRSTVLNMTTPTTGHRPTQEEKLAHQLYCAYCNLQGHNLNHCMSFTQLATDQKRQ